MDERMILPSIPLLLSVRDTPDADQSNCLTSILNSSDSYAFRAYRHLTSLQLYTFVHKINYKLHSLLFPSLNFNIMEIVENERRVQER